MKIQSTPNYTDVVSEEELQEVVLDLQTNGA